MGSCASKTVVRNARQASLRQASGGPARPEMTTPKIAIVYYSMYGHVRTLALAEKKGLESAGCEVTLLKVPETLSDEVLGKMGAPGCVEIKILRRVRAESSRRPPRHRRDACSMAWRCRFLAARPSQVGRVIAEK